MLPDLAIGSCRTPSTPLPIALGYKPPEASRRVLAVEAKDLSSEDLIRRALQAAGR